MATTSRYDRYTKAIRICWNPNEDVEEYSVRGDWKDAAMSCVKHFLMVLEQNNKTRFYEALSFLRVADLVEVFVTCSYLLRNSSPELNRKLFSLLVRVCIVSGKYSQLFQLFLHMARRNCFVGVWAEYSEGTVESSITGESWGDVRRDLALIARYWNSYDLCGLFPWDYVIEAAFRGDQEAEVAVHWLMQDSFEVESRRWTQLSNDASVWTEIDLLEYTKQSIIGNSVEEEKVVDASNSKLGFVSGPLEVLYSSDFGVLHVCDFPFIPPVFHSSNGTKRHVISNFVLLEHFVPIIRECLQCIALGIPILLQGPAGSGKSTLLNLLSQIREQVFHSEKNEEKEYSSMPQTVSLCMSGCRSIEDFDELVGTIVPESQSEGFVWKAGPIGAAIEGGHWLVLEDLHNTPQATLCGIERLVELRSGEKLDVSGRKRPLETAFGFHLFGTSTCSEVDMQEPQQCQSSWEPPGGSWKWKRIHLPSLLQNENDGCLSRILTSRFPCLHFCHQRLISTIFKLLHMYRERNWKKGLWCRSPTLTDWIRICLRLEYLQGENVITPQLAVCECLDVLCAWDPDTSRKSRVYSVLSEAWSLPWETVQSLDTTECPTISTSNPSSVVRIGRFQWRRNESNSSSNPSALSNNSSSCSWMKQTLRLWERIGRCVEMKEPVLLCGETGTGKTSAIQELAKMIGVSVVVLNLSPQTEWSDLVGSFQPQHPFQDIQHLHRLFLDAFCLSFGAEKNQNFLHHLDASLRKKDVDRCYRLIVGAWKKIEQSLSLVSLENSQQEKWYTFREYLTRFERLYGDISGLSVRKRKRKEEEKERKHSIMFRFQVGPLIRAMKEGHWILLDEINLAPFEILEGLTMLLERNTLAVSHDSLGDVRTNEEKMYYLEAHPNFRIFAAMNPPTDVGKRGLRQSIRNKFTEIYVDDHLDEEDAMILICKRYFGRNREECTDEEYRIAEDVARFYFTCRDLCSTQYLVDSNGRKPHYSLRSLCRMLSLAQSIYCRSRCLEKSWMRHKRALYEGALLSFVSPLPISCRSSIQRVADEIFLTGNSLRNMKISDLVKVADTFSSSPSFIEMEGYWIFCQRKERNASRDDNSNISHHDNVFIETPCVKHTMRDILRTLQYGAPKYAVLLQGPTACGKTSLVSYLARKTGQTLLRINHHEHMDLSEYFGNFQMDDTGSFQFVQGPLLRAVRLGYWVVMDELNLAPNELLEALNRLLDDNREIYVPDLAQTFRAHENFVLFATQNPSGEYAGRKQLSRAFRGRFIELNVSELPLEELNTILQRRYRLASSFTDRMIKVMHELQVQRTRERIFLGKESLISARDLFRWASRSPDSKASLAREGFYLLGERCRTAESREFVRKVLVDCIGVGEDELKDERLYDSFSYQNDERWKRVLDKLNVVPTPSLFRMITLVKKALEHREPVLLIGETGIGKTTCIQLLAEYENNLLWTVSCHRHLDVSDFVGAFRPTRQKKTSDSKKLFEWVDGPLVSAMKGGNYFLLDEVNMASDAVIERLNSVLEPERTLTEYQNSSTESLSNLVAHDSFCFIAAMNPASDYGKKECSTAFRSRCTEIWVPPTNTAEEYVSFIAHSWPTQSPFHIYVQPMQELVLQVLSDLETLPSLEKQILYSMFTWRDIRSWMNFIESSRECFQHFFSSYAHGFDLILLDGMRCCLSSFTQLEKLEEKWRTFLWNQCRERMSLEEMEQELYIQGLSNRVVPMWEEDSAYRFFSNIKLNKVHHAEQQQRDILSVISLDTNTMRRNAFRIVRAMLLKKPILLQGPPGIGKTSMILALAACCGQRLLRVNLSEHTEMSDLIGMDVPNTATSRCDEENGATPFVFRPGPLLVALQRGYWILLDELNLAPQTVLEGLNSLLDHRRSIYVAELDKEFYADDQTHFMLFATQNPAVDGGGRKQLPRSFLSRFTRVAMEELHLEDMCQIAEKRFPQLDRCFIRNGLQVLRNIQCNNHNKNNEQDEEEEQSKSTTKGMLVEDLNLRDVLRWFSCVDQHCKEIGDFYAASRLFFESLIVERLGTSDIRKVAMEKYVYQIGENVSTENKVQVGNLTKMDTFAIYRKDSCHIQAGVLEITWNPSLEMEGQDDSWLGECLSSARNEEDVRWIESYQRNAWILSIGILHDWPMIVIGKKGSGRKSLLRALSHIFGHRLVEWNPAGMDADGSSFIGSYQVFNIWEALWELLHVEDMLAGYRRRVMKIDKETMSVEEKKHLVENLYLVSKKMKALCMELHKKDIQSLYWIDKELERMIAFVGSSLQQVVNASCRGWMESLIGRLQACRRLCRSDQKSFSMFHWAYSTFMEAARRGDWICIDEAHRYPPAVLDALNPFLEDSLSGTRKKKAVMEEEEGALAAANNNNKKQQFHVHPNFRVFFVVEQGKQHQLSKALWNRALVTWLPEVATEQSENVIHPAISRKDIYKLSHTLIERNAFTCPIPSLETSVVQLATRWWNQNVVARCCREMYWDRICSFVFGFLHSMGKPSHLGMPEDSILAHMYWLFGKQYRQDSSFSERFCRTQEYEWLQQWLEWKMPKQVGSFLLLWNYPTLYLSELWLQMSFWAKYYYGNASRWLPLIIQLAEFSGLQPSHPVLKSLLSWLTQSSTYFCKSIPSGCTASQKCGWLVKEGVAFLLHANLEYGEDTTGKNFEQQMLLLLRYCLYGEEMEWSHTQQYLWTIASWTWIQHVDCLWNEMDSVVIVALWTLCYEVFKDRLPLLLYFQGKNAKVAEDWFHSCQEFLLSLGGWKWEFLQSYCLFEPLQVLQRQEIHPDIDDLVNKYTRKAQVQWYAMQRSQVDYPSLDIPTTLLSRWNGELQSSPLLCIGQETAMAFTVWHFWTSLLFWDGKFLTHCSKQLVLQWLDAASMLSSSDWNMECLISQQQLIWLSETNGRANLQLAWMGHFIAQGSLSVIRWLFQNATCCFPASKSGWLSLLNDRLCLDWQRCCNSTDNDDIDSDHMLGYSLQLHQWKVFLNQILDILYILDDDQRLVFEPRNLFWSSYQVHADWWKRMYSRKDCTENHGAIISGEDDFCVGWKWFTMGRQHLQECILSTSKYHPGIVAQHVEEWRQITKEMWHFRFLHFLQGDSDIASYQEEASKDDGLLLFKDSSHLQSLSHRMKEYSALAETFASIIHELLSTERLDDYQAKMWKWYETATKRMEENDQDCCSRWLQEWNQWQSNLEHSLRFLAKTSDDWGLVDQVLIAGYEMLLGSCFMTRHVEWLWKQPQPTSTCSNVVVSLLPSKCIHRVFDAKTCSIFMSQLIILKWLYYVTIESNVSTIRFGMTEIRKHLDRIVAELGVQTSVDATKETPISYHFLRDSSSSKEEDVVWLDDASRSSWDQLYLQAHLLEDMTSDHQIDSKLEKYKRHIWFIQMLIGMLTGRTNSRRTSFWKQKLQEIYSFASHFQDTNRILEPNCTSSNSQESDRWHTGGWLLLFGMQGDKLGANQQETAEEKNSRIFRKVYFQFYQDPMPTSEMVLLKEPWEQTYKYLCKQQSSNDSRISGDLKDRIEQDLNRIQRVSKKTPMIHIAQLVKQWKDHLVVWQKEWLGKGHSIGQVIAQLEHILDKWNTWMTQHWEEEWIEWREERAQEKSIDYFFPLYIFLSQSLSSSGVVAREDVMQVMDFYLRTAVIADFSLRLHIVKSFWFLLGWNHPTSWLVQLLRGIYCYYQQYEETIQRKYLEKRKAAVEKIQRNMQYAYHYSETSAQEMKDKFGFPIALRQKAIQVARELENDLSDSITCLLKEDMENNWNPRGGDTKAKQLFDNISHWIVLKSRETTLFWEKDRWFQVEKKEKKLGWLDKVSHLQSIWNDSFQVFLCSEDRFSRQDFQHWLYILKQNEISCHPSAVPSTHRSLSVQLSCPLISEGEQSIDDSWDTLETVSLQDQLYFSCLAQSCWIRRWLSYMPQLGVQDFLSGDRKQIWNEMNMALYFGKYLQYLSMQFRQVAFDIRHRWRSLRHLQADKPDNSDSAQFFVQYTEWIALYEEYCKRRQSPVEKEEQMWFSQLQRAVEEEMDKKQFSRGDKNTRDSSWSSLEQLLQVPSKRRWPQGIFAYVQDLACLWKKSQQTSERRVNDCNNEETNLAWLMRGIRKELENGEGLTCLDVVCQDALKALRMVKEQILDSISVVGTNDLQSIVSDAMQVALIGDAICCLWWKLTNDMISFGIYHKWLLQEDEEQAAETQSGGTDIIKGTGLQDASIQSLQQANDISDQLNEQDWQEAFEQLGSSSQENQQQPEEERNSTEDPKHDVEAQVEMDDTWQDSGEVEGENEQVEDVEAGNGEKDPKVSSENQDTNGLEPREDDDTKYNPSSKDDFFMDNDNKNEEETASEEEKTSELKEEYLESTSGEFKGDVEEQQPVDEEMEIFPETLDNISDSASMEDSHEREEMGMEDETSMMEQDDENDDNYTNESLNEQQSTNNAEEQVASKEEESSRQQQLPESMENETKENVEELNRSSFLDEKGTQASPSPLQDPRQSSSSSMQKDSTQDANWILNPYTQSSEDIWNHLLEKLDISWDSTGMEEEPQQGMNSDMQEMEDSIKVSPRDTLEESVQEQVLDSQEEAEEPATTNALDMDGRQSAKTKVGESSGIDMELNDGEEEHSLLQNQSKDDKQSIKPPSNELEQQWTEETVDSNSSFSVTQDLDRSLLDEQVDLSHRIQPYFMTRTITGKDAQIIWQQLLQKTSQDAALLAERLQMILEPSVTSQLTGSYRTGKRLSMKRVIEFYASEFRKDRIWLRRVQPDRRSYDVLIAIDDSASMMESQASILAMETLALLASSFTRYEIGRLAVARFGKEVKWLRSFEDSMSMEVGGAEILQQFRFEQNATDIAELLRQAIVFLKESKATSQASMSTIQLFFILSDGRLQDRVTIQKLVREAWENGQLIVFLLTDSVNKKQQSIVDLKRVETLENGELKISSYMDDFPFPFYILVRQVESLPQIVASALQEWIEMMNPSRLDSL